MATGALDRWEEVIAEHPHLGLAVPKHPTFSQRVYASPSGSAYTILYTYDDNEVVLLAMMPVPSGVYG